ncbi:uncharacterized protein LOC115006916 [Cottoperca gobio]|uniref:Uncharacterized protein LOC115006916 n=1 Tax=Cottoperca gobio TaxID=56716 RepID=A0A6J2PJV7_COTGO|nr:uncharacterized protein LOC115006916 [Cottoperca gobio]
MKVHPIFHVTRVKPVKESPLVPTTKPSPPPQFFEGGDVYTVKRLLAARRKGRGYQYLVDWERYGPEETQWVSTKNIVDQTLIQDFHCQHPEVPGTSVILGPKCLRNAFSNDIEALDGINLASSTNVRNLGVIFDQDLSFNSHINQISRTAFFHLHNIAKIRHILSQNDAEKLVHAFVISTLDYCNSLLSTLQLIQNAVARVLTRTRKRDHITPVLAALHWLPVKYRIEFKILLLTYKAINGQAPAYFKDLIVPYKPTRALRSQTAGLLVVPRVSKSTMGARAFSYQAPLQWNQLPVCVREADTLSTFKSRLKIFLFYKAYS